MCYVMSDDESDVDAEWMVVRMDSCSWYHQHC